MHIMLYNHLVQLARAQGLTTYSDIAPLANLSMDNAEDRERISQLLGEIVLQDVAEGRPMLTALVVHRGKDNNPGEGFFTVAAQLGRFTGTRQQLPRLEFWMSQVKETHAYWATH